MQYKGITGQCKHQRCSAYYLKSFPLLFVVGRSLWKRSTLKACLLFKITGCSLLQGITLIQGRAAEMLSPHSQPPTPSLAPNQSSATNQSWSPGWIPRIGRHHPSFSSAHEACRFCCFLKGENGKPKQPQGTEGCRLIAHSWRWENFWSREKGCHCNRRRVSWLLRVRTKISGLQLEGSIQRLNSRKKF